MRAFLSNLILPLPIFWIFIILAVLFWFRHKMKHAQYIFSISLIWLFVVSTPFLPNFLIFRLENQFETFHNNTFANKSKNIHILILGGGHTNDSRLPANNQLSAEALSRLAEGIRIHRQIPGSTIKTSGWSGKREKVPQAEVLARTAILLGIDSIQIKKLILSENTWMEATEYKRLFGDYNQLILVTSAVHMPRAMYLFQKAGLEPVPAPANHLIKKGTKRNHWFWLPSSGNISKMESAIHEYVGLLWYKMIVH